MRRGVFKTLSYIGVEYASSVGTTTSRPLCFGTEWYMLLLDMRLQYSSTDMLLAVRFCVLHSDA